MAQYPADLAGIVIVIDIPILGRARISSIAYCAALTLRSEYGVSLLKRDSVFEFELPALVAEHT